MRSVRRLAVAVPSSVVPAWQARAVDALRAIGDVDVVVIAAGDRPMPPPPRLAAAMFRLTCAPVRLDTVERKSFDGYDLVLDLGDGRVASDAPCGVWSYRIGRDNDLRFPFAQEYASGDATVEIELVRKTSTTTTSIRRGRFAASSWYPSTVHKALSEATSWPAELVRALRSGAALQEYAPVLPSVPARRDGRRAIVPFLGSIASRLVRGLASEALTDHRWNVGFVAGGPRRLLSGEPLEVTWLNGARSGGWIADPFMVERDGVRAIFVEDMDEARGRGVVDALVVDDAGNVIRRHRIIERPTHLSYPYPIDIDGELYLVPENWATNAVTPYRCVRFPDIWEEEPPLIPDLDAVDTTIVRHRGRWWALLTRETRGPDLALHAYHADSPRGTWLPHALNPVVIDVATARPAGRPFIVDGTLYRPAQDCSAAYGSAVTIARVDELTPLSYRETVVRRLVPDRMGPYRDGLHTLSVCGDRVVIDGKQTFHDLCSVGGRLSAIARRGMSALSRRYFPH